MKRAEIHKHLKSLHSPNLVDPLTMVTLVSEKLTKPQKLNIN